MLYGVRVNGVALYSQTKVYQFVNKEFVVMPISKDLILHKAGWPKALVAYLIFLSSPISAVSTTNLSVWFLSNLSFFPSMVAFSGREPVKK